MLLCVRVCVHARACVKVGIEGGRVLMGPCVCVCVNNYAAIPTNKRDPGAANGGDASRQGTGRRGDSREAAQSDERRGGVRRRWVAGGKQREGGGGGATREAGVEAASRGGRGWCRKPK